LPSVKVKKTGGSLFFGVVMQKKGPIHKKTKNFFKKSIDIEEETSRIDLALKIDEC